MRKPLILIFLAVFSAHFLAAQCPFSNEPGLHVVQKGDNLYRISIRYKVPITDLCAWNDVTETTTLPLCKQLIVKAPPASARESSRNDEIRSRSGEVLTERSGGSSTGSGKPFSEYFKQYGGKHVVDDGETVANLARLYGYTEERFREFNSLRSGETVSPGTVLFATECDCAKTKEPAQSDGYFGKKPAIEPATDTRRQSEERTSGSSKSGDFENPENVVIGSKNNKDSGSSKPGNAPVSPGEARKKASAYMSSEELAMLDEINLMRSNPSGYVKYVEDYIDKISREGGWDTSPAAARELIEELKKTPVLSLLEPVECIQRAARKHGEDQKPTGEINHQGTDKSWPWDRVRRECPSMSEGNENLVGGPDNVREAIMLLLVDDGIETRGHRRNLLDKTWKYAACYKVGKVGGIPDYWVQNFGK